MTWNDLNYPARLSTLAAAGLPMIQKRNCGSIVAMDNLARKHDIGIFFDDIKTLNESFADKDRIRAVKENAWNCRYLFSFDYYVKDLTNFFHMVISNKRKK